MDELLRIWRLCHDFVLFFDDFPAWLNAQGISKNIPDYEKLLLEYDDLFKGTNADIYIPLWASACKGNGDILLDTTTLDLIKTYNAWGYEAVPMDGNPPDFIGQQFRFLCYLSAVELHSPAAGCGQAREKFRDSFLTDTVRALSEGIRRYGVSPVFHPLADRLETFPEGDVSKIPLEQLYCYDISQNGRRPARPDKEQRIINTTGTNNCGGRCVIRITEQEGCVLDISTECGNGGEPALRACIRGLSYRETFINSRRLRYPMVRTGERGEGRFRRISWEDAADITIGEWKRIRDTHGPSSRYVNYSTGVQTVFRPDNIVRRLLFLDGGSLLFYNNYSNACLTVTTPYIYGDTLTGNSFETVLDAKLIILWGFNPKETIFGTRRFPYLLKARAKGIRIIVIDPRHSDTARACADQWIGIKPSSDAALADAMAYVIWSEGLQDQHFMDTYCQGFDEAHMPEGIKPGESYETYLFGKKDGIPKTPEWAETITGVPAGTIRNLAREYAAAKPGCILPGYGPQRTGSGEQTVRAVALLTALTGNIGKIGGSAGVLGEVPNIPFTFFPLPENPYPGKIPCFLWTKAAEHALEMSPEKDGLIGVERLSSNIKMILNFAGNTLINQHSDINRTIRLLKDTGKIEFIVGSDIFMTPSAKFFDLLLPGASSFENNNIAQSGTGADSYLLFCRKAVEPLFGCRFEYDFIQTLAKRLGLEEPWSTGYATFEDLIQGRYNELRKIAPEAPEFEAFKDGAKCFFNLPKPYIAYESQIRDPDHHPFKTPSGKIEIFSRRLYDLNRPKEIPAIPCYVPCPEGPEDPLREKYPLQLIGWHTKKRTHSVHDINMRLDKIDPQCLWMHPDDAKARGIEDKQPVEIMNDRGRIRIEAHITTRIIPGAVALSQGGWYTPDASGTDTRGSINVLTSQIPTPLARGNPQHTNLVEVRKYISFSA
ncbi:DMSO/selenate family reductase complex A subunit [Treponema primitia]|uniref:DMSO/selenate family reductase complex A subunit n=1 Tax=Treponema primitia TaxID=88058 RepID=UPI0002555830|nr:DMSO/selenate family reductase complex A subunit [Treponema primitia]